MRHHAVVIRSVIVFHFAWTVFLWGGMVLALFWKPYIPTELLILSITLLSNVPFRGGCPLTILEEHYREKISPGYERKRSFMTTYINKLLKTDFTVKQVNITIAVIYVLAYAILMWRLIPS